MKKQKTRVCKDCSISFEWKPRRLICIDCYKKRFVTNDKPNDITLFIEEED